MAKHITVRGAQPHTREQEPERVYITINGCFPYSTGSEEAELLRQGFKEDAEKLFEALMSLPGGTFCQLLVLMLQEKASQFIVSHRPTAEYRKMEAAPEMFKALELGDSLGNDGPYLLDYAAGMIHTFAPHTTQELHRKAEAERKALAKARGESEGQNV
jgi:hypothetical protein